jgi:hypothetical protein
VIELEKYTWAVVDTDGGAAMFADKPTAQTYAEARAKEGRRVALCKVTTHYNPSFAMTNV